MNNNTFTIGGLAKIALGDEELTNEHLKVLQNVFLTLLQKLNCQNEVVKVKGVTAKCLQKLLNENPNGCQYKFQFENPKNFKEKYDLLSELERKTKEIESKMNQHFGHIRNCNKTDEFAAHNWHLYPSPTEDLCSRNSKEYREYSFLTQNSVFNTELRKRVVPKVFDKFKKFEDKIEAMQDKLKEITQTADETIEKLKIVEFIVKDIEELRSFINIRHKDFSDTIAEVEEMLSCKLHRVTVPALKKYLEKRFAEANEHLRILKFGTKKCPPSKPLLIEDKKTCLSCSRHQDFKFLKKFKTLKSIEEGETCSCCNLLKEQSIREKLDRMRSSDQADQSRSSKGEDTLLSFGENASTNVNTLKPTLRKQEMQETCLRGKEGCEDKRVSQQHLTARMGI